MNLSKFLPQIIDFISSWLRKEPEISVTIPLDNPVPEQPKNAAWTLTRISCEADGIFSELHNPKGEHVCFVAEHAYNSLPKLPNGTWTVKLGMHQLDHGGPQELFCVQNVPGHEGICLHIGNAPQKDSDGCLLLGQSITMANGAKIVTASRFTFDQFMKSMAGIDEFQLIVS